MTEPAGGVLSYSIVEDVRELLGHELRLVAAGVCLDCLMCEVSFFVFKWVHSGRRSPVWHDALPVDFVVQKLTVELSDPFSSAY